MMAKHVSLDEYLSSTTAGGLSRKHFARDSGVVLKAARASVEKRASYKKGDGRITFVMSAEVEDRDKDIVIQAGLKTEEFEKNPVAPWGHRASDFPVGKWENVVKHLSGRPKRTEGELVLTMDDPQAQRLDAHFAAGSLAACSIGFMPLSIERRELDDEDEDGYYRYPGYIIHEAELYECSPCTIPANPAALAKAAAEGDTLSRELIEHVLDTWDLRNGVIMPRKAFEDAHRDARGGNTVVLHGKRFEVGPLKGGLPVLTPVDEAPEVALLTSLETDKSLLGRLKAALGMKSEPEAAPAPTEPAAPPASAPEPTTEPPAAPPESTATTDAPEPEADEATKAAREQMAKDLPAIQAKARMIEAETELALLEAQTAA